MRAALLLVVLSACRSAPSNAVPLTDPPVQKPPPPPPSKVATVTTQRIEIPRKGHAAIVLELPVVKGIDAADSVNAHLTAEKILGQSVAEVRADAKLAKPDEVPPGVQGTTFKVPYNADDLLEVEAFTEFFGAYPSTSRYHVVIDLRTGAAIGAEAFLRPRVPALVKKLEAMRAAETKAAMVKEPDLKGFVTDVHFEEHHLGDFSPRPTGIIFNFDYGFPHVALAIQPPGQYLVPWSEVAADLDPKSPLARAKR